jgi:hypothetical protein
MTTPTELKAEIDARAASDPVFASMLAVRDDNGMAAALSVGRTKLVETMLTERGVMSALGIVDGETALSSLETFAASTPSDPDLVAVHPGIKRMLGWLKTTGVDVGNPLTRSLLDLLASKAVLTAAAVTALKALAVVADVVSAAQVSEAIDNG